jgi:DNA-binding GntR family transcriptional regulator
MDRLFGGGVINQERKLAAALGISRTPIHKL